MIDKALNDIEAANKLTYEDDPDLAFTSSAASRLYYAVYHACWAFFESQSVQMDRHDYGEDWYRHGQLRTQYHELAEFKKLVGSDWISDARKAYGLRVKADYMPDSPEEAEVQWLLNWTKVVVGKVCDALQEE